MPTYFCRVTSDFSYTPFLNDDSIKCYVIVGHNPDMGCKRPHYHMIIDTELGHKKFRKTLRALGKAEGRMDVYAESFDETKFSPRYLMRLGAKLLYSNPDTNVGKSVYEFTQSKAFEVTISNDWIERNAPKITMKDRIEKIYEELSNETSEPILGFGTFAELMLTKYYKDRTDDIIPGEGAINVFKSYITHYWGLYITNHLPAEHKDRAFKRLTRYLFGQSVVDPVHDVPTL